MAIFGGHSAKCRPKSSVWGLVLWLDVKLVYSVHPGVESLNIIPCGQQFRQSALQADSCGQLAKMLHVVFCFYLLVYF